MELPPLDLAAVPPPVLAVVDALAERGHAAYLVGGCVRDLLTGADVGDFDVTTAAAADEVLAIFPAAIPIGLRHGTVMVPTTAGPVDVTTFRAGPRIEDDLAHRDFTINALACDPRSGTLLDPFDGRSHLEKGELHAVRSAEDRFAEDPLRALRAARLATTLELTVDPSVERAMSAARTGLRKIARERIRHELSLLLMAPGVAQGLELLVRTGLAAEIAPDAAADAAAVVPRLPAELEVRLAGWLRGANAAAILRRLRYARRVTQRVDRLLRIHPIDENTASLRDADLRRLIKRAGESNLETLRELRLAEIDSGQLGARADATRNALGALYDALGRVRKGRSLALRRFDLALDGSAVMRLLDCRPGPQVGRALRYLTDCVIEDPTCNTEDGLRALLERWAADSEG
jgi:tRNA nucleotidyltransferase (CCA-adding enzyme)